MRVKHPANAVTLEEARKMNATGEDTAPSL